MSKYPYNEKWRCPECGNICEVEIDRDEFIPCFSNAFGECKKCGWLFTEDDCDPILQGETV